MNSTVFYNSLLDQGLVIIIIDVDRMFLWMQDFDFAQIKLNLSKSNRFYSNFASILPKSNQICINYASILPKLIKFA